MELVETIPLNHEFEVQLLKEGLQFLDDALSRFMEIKGMEEAGSALANATHGLLVLGERLYADQSE